MAWAEQFPRGGGLCGACYVLSMCRRAFAGELRVSHSAHTDISLAQIRASKEHARQTPTYTFFTTAISRRNTHWENSLMMILHTHTTFALTLSRPRQRLFS